MKPQLPPTDDAWEDSPPASDPKAALVRIRQLQGEIAGLAKQQAKPVAIAPIPAGVQRDLLPFAIMGGLIFSATTLGGMAMWMGNQPNQMNAAVIAQLAENNKILAQSRPSITCIAIVCPPMDTGAIAPQAPAQTVSVSNEVPQSYPQWVAFFQQQQASGNTATWQRYFADNPQEQGTEKHQAFIAAVGGGSGGGVVQSGVMPQGGAIAPQQQPIMPFTPGVAQ